MQRHGTKTLHLVLDYELPEHARLVCLDAYRKHGIEARVDADPEVLRVTAMDSHCESLDLAMNAASLFSSAITLESVVLQRNDRSTRWVMDRQYEPFKVTMSDEIKVQMSTQGAVSVHCGPLFLFCVRARPLIDHR